MNKIINNSLSISIWIRVINKFFFIFFNYASAIVKPSALIFTLKKKKISNNNDRKIISELMAGFPRLIDYIR